jgi:hypothetical protein
MGDEATVSLPLEATKPLPNMTIRSCFRGFRAGSRRVEVLGANEIVQKMNEIGHRLQ